MPDNKSRQAIQNSADDEPLFTVCARDPDAPGVVREWARRAELSGVPEWKTKGALRVADQMEDWQRRNPDKIKVPD